MKSFFCLFRLKRSTYSVEVSEVTPPLGFAHLPLRKGERRTYRSFLAKVLAVSRVTAPLSLSEGEMGEAQRGCDFAHFTLTYVPLCLMAAIALGGCGKKSKPDAPIVTGASANSTDANSAPTDNVAPNDASAADENGAPTVKLASVVIGSPLTRLCLRPARSRRFPIAKRKSRQPRRARCKVCRSNWATKFRAEIFWRSFRRRRFKAKSPKLEAALNQSQVAVQQAQASALQQEAQSSTGILQAQAQVSQEQANLQGAQATLINARQTLSRNQALFNEGLIARKDVEAAQLAVRTAQAQVAAQQRTIEAQRQNVAAARAASLQNAVKREDVKIARQQVEGARAALQTARNQLALYTIRAPISGTLTSVDVGPGATVDTTTPIATLTDLSRLQLSIAVPADSANLVGAGQTVKFEVQSVPNRIFTARIDSLSNGIDAATGTLSRVRWGH